MTFPQLGAQVVNDGAVFTAFASETRSCRVGILDDAGEITFHDMPSSGDGLFATKVSGAGHGTLYQLWLDGQAYPDPYARYLPRGVHGPAMVVEPRHRWRHGPGIDIAPARRVVYELHVGTFTADGTFAAATERLGELADLGVTVVELMPVAAFAGRWGWGYDGVANFAPHASYGTPDDLRRLVDEAHGLGLAVVLDVVYNHFGPAGNYLAAFSPRYFTTEARNGWGAAPNFRHPAMRRYVLDNARQWLVDYRFDGLRLDATHAIIDPSPVHVVEELATLAHGLSPRKVVIAEDERNDAALVTSAGIDAQWADDFHHAAHVTATGERDGYYANYRPGAAGIADTLDGGWLYRGQVYPSSGQPRGTSTDGMTAGSFVYCLQNHDQVGNRALGERLCHVAGVEKTCALATVLLFAPMTPMLFMGEEWAASSPFQYFTDHDRQLGELVSRGRRDEFKHFTAFSDAAARDRIPDPQAEATFHRSKLKWQERTDGDHARVLALYRALLRLRREDPVLSNPSRERFQATARGDVLICRRWIDASERVLVANLANGPVEVGELLAGRAVVLRSDGVSDASGGAWMSGWSALIAGDRG